MDAILVLVGYVVGTTPFALLVTRRVGGRDLRRVGSGNVGAANVLRAAGAPAAAVVLALDVGKGSAAMLLARSMGVSDAGAAAVAAAAVVGHVFPIWLRFRGGKGVATACGVFMVQAPAATGLAAAAFAGVVWTTRYVSLGSMAASVVLALAVCLSRPPAPAVACAIGVAALVLHRHRSNVARLRAGCERRIGQRAQESR